MIRTDTLTRTYATRQGDLKALDSVSLSIDEGSFVTIRGESGCGKTTLLLSLGGMLHPTSGEVRVSDIDIYHASQPERTRLRADSIGFIFQMFHLVPYLNVVENIKLGAGDVGSAEIDALLQQLGLEERATHRPDELSAGERQRVAIARALIKSPLVILADEPTGNLDPDNAREVFKHLQDFHEQGGTVVVVTHGPESEQYSDRVITMKKGQVVSDIIPKHQTGETANAQ